MAETTLHFVGDDIEYVKIYDASSPTPLEYEVKLTGDSSVTLTNGHFSHSVPTDPSGAAESGAIPRKSGVESYCSIQINHMLRDAGDNTSDEVFMDIVNWDGDVAANWSSTTDVLTSEKTAVATVHVDVKLKDRTNAAGTVNGAVYRVPHARLDGAFETTMSRQGFVVSPTFRSVNTVKYTVTRNT